MKDMRADVVASLILVGTTLLSMPAWSMDEMTDGQLATTTGQDGLTVTIGLPGNTLTLAQVALFDGDGIAAQPSVGTGTGFAAQVKGALVIGKNANGSAVGTNPTLGNGVSLTMSGPISFVADTSGGGAVGITTGLKPVFNAAINLPTTLTLVTGDIGIASAVGSAGSYQVGTAASGGDVIVMNSSSMTFTLSGSPQLNLQLGNPNQGSMIQLTSLNISSIVFNTPLSLASPNGVFTPTAAQTAAGMVAGTIGTSSLTATPSVTGLNLSGATIDVLTKAGVNSASGLGVTTGATAGAVLFQDASLTVGSFALNNVTAGTSGNGPSVASNPGTVVFSGADPLFASGMKNAPLGSFGVTNMVVGGLKIGISGM